MSWVDKIKVGDRLKVLEGRPWGANVFAGEEVEIVNIFGDGTFMYSSASGSEWYANRTGAARRLEPIGKPKKRSDNLRPELEWLNTVKPGDELEIFDPYDRNYAKPGDRVIYVSDDGDMGRGGASCYVRVESPTGHVKTENLSGCAFRFRAVTRQKRFSNLSSEYEWLNDLTPGFKLAVIEDCGSANGGKLFAGDVVEYLGDDNDMSQGAHRLLVKVRLVSTGAVREVFPSRIKPYVEPKAGEAGSTRLQLREAIRMRLAAGVIQ